MSYKISRAILKFIFGKYAVDLSWPVVGTTVNKRRVKYEIQMPGINSRDISRTLWQLRRTKLLEFREEGERVKIVLTESGRKRVLSYQLDEMVIKEPKRWDGNWHIVVFDIPEKKKSARNALAEKMKDLGLVLFQKSVWIYPYNCQDEVDSVAEIFEVGKYVHYIITRSITYDRLLRGKFGLR